jgi:oligopeptide/dipeptide ABC transporter ATP-binding protein
MSDALLSIRDLRVGFRTQRGHSPAVAGVSFDVRPGETVGIVGESGSGKSVTNLSVLRLIPSPPCEISGGEIRFEGRDLLKASERELRDLRGGKIAMIFQDPMSSLHPLLRISTQMMELTRLHLGLDKRAAKDHAVQMLAKAGIPDAARVADGYPHQLSGGMRQRVMTAMALSTGPKLLIADEPTTALDVTIQALILDLIRRLRDETGAAVLFTTHDLGVIAGMADRVVVMYAGRVFETAPAGELFRTPRNPYTRALLRSIPDLARNGSGGREKLFQIPGLPPVLAEMKANECPFAARCPEVEARCREGAPPFEQVGAEHYSLCWRTKS